MCIRKILQHNRVRNKNKIELFHLFLRLLSLLGDLWCWGHGWRLSWWWDGGHGWSLSHTFVAVLEAHVVHADVAGDWHPQAWQEADQDQVQDTVEDEGGVWLQDVTTVGDTETDRVDGPDEHDDAEEAVEGLPQL